MTDKLKQTIKDELAKLPKENQEAVSALDWVKISEETGKKYFLSESELNDLQVQIMLVLIGFIDFEDFVRNIENEVIMSKEEAEKIIEEIDQKILTPIYDILVENIKRSEKSKNPDLVKTFDFILSGGDYSAFLERQNIEETSGGAEGGETVLPEFSIK